MKNSIQDGKILTLAAPTGGVTSGVGYLIGDIFGVAQTTQLVGVDTAFLISGVVELAKATGVTFAVGDRVFFDPAAGNVTTQAAKGAARDIGVAVKLGESGDTTLQVRLDESIDPQNVITVLQPYASAPAIGDGVLVGGTFGIALEASIAQNYAIKIRVGGNATLPKLNTDTCAAGAVLYWDNTNKRLTTTATSNYKVARALEARTNPTTTVLVRLNDIALTAEAGA